MRAALRFLAVLVALAAGASCGGANDERERSAPAKTGASKRETGPYSAREREWLGKMGAWRSTLDRALRLVMASANDPEASRLLREGDSEAYDEVVSALYTLVDCTKTYEEHVGRAPSRRLEEGARLTLEACPDLERGAREDLRALKEKDEELLDAGDGFIESGAEQLWVANKKLLLRSEGRDLPRVRGRSAKSHVDPLLGRVADALAEDLPTSVEVRCWSTRDWPRVLDELSAYHGAPANPEEVAGFAASDLVRIHLAPHICSALARLAEDRRASRRRPVVDAFAVTALAHETMHVAWVDDEAEAQCYAAQLADETAVRLGLRRDEAAALARVGWKVIYPRLPREYRSPECRNGGAFDLRPGDGVFP